MGDLLAGVNPVTILLFTAFLIPVIAGAFSAFSKERIRSSINSLLGYLELGFGLILSIYLVRRIFFEHDGSFFQKVYDFLPDKLTDFLYGQDVLTYIAGVPLLLMILLFIIRSLTTPLYQLFFVPLSEKLHSAVNSMGLFFKRLMGALWELPRAAFYVLVFALVLNFSTYYLYVPNLSKWMNESKEYQFIYQRALYPVLNSNLAKQIPVLVNDSFRRVSGDPLPGGAGSAIGKIGERLTGGNIRVIEYFNGVTLDEAIRSNEQIDATAVKVVGKEKDDAKKAYLIYRWIAKNIRYDYEKAKNIAANPRGIDSGSIVVFETRKGICFDYSSLYVSMCRAVGLKVRLVTGLGYSGVSWGDHAWNQVYSADENRWIHLDTTFGSTGVNYFDKRDFEVDHRNDDIQGEW